MKMWPQQGQIPFKNLLNNGLFTSQFLDPTYDLDPVRKSRIITPISSHLTTLADGKLQCTLAVRLTGMDCQDGSNYRSKMEFLILTDRSQSTCESRNVVFQCGRKRKCLLLFLRLSNWIAQQQKWWLKWGKWFLIVSKMNRFKSRVLFLCVAKSRVWRLWFFDFPSGLVSAALLCAGPLPFLCPCFLHISCCPLFRPTSESVISFLSRSRFGRTPSACIWWSSLECWIRFCYNCLRLPEIDSFINWLDWTET
jgi:hypothetical protein